MKKYFTYLSIIVSINLFGQKVDLNHGEIQNLNYYEEFNFEFIKDKIIVSVELEDKSYKFILDTGAPNIISKELDSLFKPRFIRKIPVSDANNVKDTLKVVSLNKLKIGNVTFKDSYSLVHDLKKTPLWECFGIDGFIGSNMLRNSIIQIDLKNKKIKLTDNKNNLDLNKKRSSKIKLTKSQSSPYVWIKLSGEDDGKEQVLIDTGADGLYDISLGNFKEFENENIFEKIGESIGASSIGMFGDVTASKHYKLRLPSMRVTGLEIENYLTNTTNDDNSRIGSDILKYGIITIDYKNKRFYIQQELDKIKATNSDFGFTRTLKNGKLIIGFVWDLELKKKIKYGDEIIEINGKPVQICDLITQNPFSRNNNSVNLKIKPAEGGIFEIVVEQKNYSQDGI